MSKFLSIETRVFSGRNTKIVVSLHDFFKQKMFKKTWDKENNGVLLTMRSTEETLNMPSCQLARRFNLNGYT
ncbi:hypothetical protein FACS189411_01360 [Bacteroidia bacterium]|nr:hypothetical protein FACS189411_01360 [Bacteroidia bacterium]